MKKTNLIALFFLTLGIASYAQSSESKVGELPMNLGGIFKNPFSYSEEDSAMRLNYFLGKQEEALPTKKVSLNFVNSEAFLSVCNCENKLVNPILEDIKVTAPNLVFEKNNNADIRIDVTFSLTESFPAEVKRVKSSRIYDGVQQYDYFVETLYNLSFEVNFYEKGKKTARYSSVIKDYKIASRKQYDSDSAKQEWIKNKKAYLHDAIDLSENTVMKTSVNDGLKANFPKPLNRLKALYTARFDKKNNNKHDFATSDEHLNNVQNYIKCEINNVTLNNILIKCENFDKVSSIKSLEAAIVFWKSQLQDKYAGVTKFDDVRKGFAFNILTTAFVLKDKESFDYASKYIVDNKFSSKSQLTHSQVVAEHLKLREEFLK